MARQRSFSLAAVAIGTLLLAPTPARAQIVSADCYVSYRLADDSLTELYVPLNVVTERNLLASLDPPFTRSATRRACLQLFRDSALADCIAGPGPDVGFVSAQVSLNTIEGAIGAARSRWLVNDVRVVRSGARIAWRKCSTFQRP